MSDERSPGQGEESTKGGGWWLRNVVVPVAVLVVGTVLAGALTDWFGFGGDNGGAVSVTVSTDERPPGAQPCPDFGSDEDGQAASVICQRDFWTETPEVFLDSLQGFDPYDFSIEYFGSPSAARVADLVEQAPRYAGDHLFTAGRVIASETLASPVIPSTSLGTREIYIEDRSDGTALVVAEEESFASEGPQRGDLILVRGVVTARGDAHLPGIGRARAAYFLVLGSSSEPVTGTTRLDSRSLTEFVRTVARGSR